MPGFGNTLGILPHTNLKCKTDRRFYSVSYLSKNEQFLVTKKVNDVSDGVN